MYFTVKAVLRSLLLPPASPLILALIGVLLLRRHRRWAIASMTLSVVSLWLFSTALIADALSQIAERYPALDLSQPTNAQAIVIIGGGGVRRFAPEYQGPAPEYVLLDRLSYGAFVARRTGLPILVSGAPDEALAMRTSLARDFGMPVRWVEGESRDTYQNAHFTAGILLGTGIKRIILVTMSTHMFRAAQEFRSVGFEVTPAPCGVWTPRERGALRFIPSPGALSRSNAALYELLGEPARRLQAALAIRERFDTKAAQTGKE
ncbi:MAG: transrane protein [Gammaproteobacteria bacterium]|nr:transrane protein [Gammaproteobacteria bacterium]